MDIYTTKDLEAFDGQIDNVVNEIKLVRYNVLEPNKEEIISVTNIIHEFLIKYKRKIYGGYALNFLLKDKNIDDAIYGELEIPDIDFYSPDPIVDLKILCNILLKKGFTDVSGREAQHKETYTISVNRQNYVDISYVPKNIYHRIPFVEVNKMNMTHPHFMIIDFYRMSTDPLTSYWRIEKMMPRIYKLLKHYPLLKINKPLHNSIKGWKPQTNNLNDVLATVNGFLRNRSSIILFGFSAYNYLLKYSEIFKADNKFSFINIPYYEFISENYNSDMNELIDLLKNTHGKEKFKIEEHYPFFQFYGYNVKVYYENNLIFWGFDINKKCLSYQEVTSMLVQNNKIYESKTDFVRIGTFPLIIMMNLILTIYYRANRDSMKMNIHQTLTSHFFFMRNYYFKTKKVTFMDKSIFQEMTTECVGPKINPQRASFEDRENKKKNKKSYTFRYDPSVGNTDPTSMYRFSNSSGNLVNNTKNLRLIKHD